MIVKRDIQIITSRFGKRKGFSRLHLGADLRTRLMSNPGIKLPIMAPEDLRIVRVPHQKKWGYTIVARGLDSGKLLKFTHVSPTDKIIKEAIISAGAFIGLPMVTEYMKSKGCPEHLHFETWSKGIPHNPVKYMNDMDIPFDYKEGV